jgi:hypothetical protein
MKSMERFPMNRLLKSYSALLASKSNVMETGYTRSMQARLAGPKDLRRKLYRNLMGEDETKLLLEWRPVGAMVDTLRKQLGSTALFFFNDLCPEVVAVLW